MVSNGTSLRWALSYSCCHSSCGSRLEFSSVPTRTPLGASGRIHSRRKRAKSHVGNKSDMSFVDRYVVQKNFRTTAKLPFGGKTLWNLESLVRPEMYLN